MSDTDQYTGYVSDVTFVNITSRSENGVVIYGKEHLISELKLINISLSIGVFSNISNPSHDWRPSPEPQIVYAPIDGFCTT